MSNVDAIYFNNAATSFPKSSLAIKAYLEVLEHIPQGIRHGSSGEGYLAKSRELVAQNLGVRSEHVYFSSGATLAINHILFGLLKVDDRCVYDNRSHNAIVQPLIQSGKKYHSIEWPLYDLAENCQINTLRQYITSDTKLICLTHVSNVTGRIYPIGKVIENIRAEFGQIPILVDASQSAGIISLEKIIDADFIVFPGHKHVFAPQGAAVVVCKRKILPTVYGGKNETTKTAYFPEVGTLNIDSIYSLAIALDLSSKRRHERLEKERFLTNCFFKRLEDIDVLEPLVAYDMNKQIGILSYKSMVGPPETELVPFFKSQGLQVRGGVHCSPGIHEQHGLKNVGSLRFSLSHHNTLEELDIAHSIIKDFQMYFRESLCA